MTQVLAGAISDELGHAAGWETVAARVDGRNFDARRAHFACPAERFRPTQPPDIPLEGGHGGPRIGSVVGLELRDKLWVVGEVDDGYDLTRQPWQLSYDLTERSDGLFDLNAVAVVERSATCCMPQIEVRDGTLAAAARRTNHQDGHTGSLIRNAYENANRRRHGDPIMVCEDPRVVERRRLAAERRGDYAGVQGWDDRGIMIRPARILSVHR